MVSMAEFRKVAERIMPRFMHAELVEVDELEQRELHAEYEWDFAGRWSDYILDATEDAAFLNSYVRSYAEAVNNGDEDMKDEILDDLRCSGDDDLGRAWVSYVAKRGLKKWALAEGYRHVLLYIDEGTIEVKIY
jgi:hypothetical protein